MPFFNSFYKTIYLLLHRYYRYLWLETIDFIGFFAVTSLVTSVADGVTATRKTNERMNQNMKYHDPWEVLPPTKHINEFCKELGSEYCIRPIDQEQVIYRNFGNGYDLEISGMNTSSLRKTAVLYLWKGTNRVVKKVTDVPQKDIGKWAEWLRQKTESWKPEDFGSDRYLKREKRTIKAGDGDDAL